MRAQLLLAQQILVVAELWKQGSDHRWRPQIALGDENAESAESIMADHMELARNLMLR